MKVYLDNCCFNRVLDDQSFPLIYLERNSVMLILELAEANILEIVGSQMLKFEMNATPDQMKRAKLLLMYSLCSSEIEVTKAIADRAEEIRENSNIRKFDSIHLACAEDVGVDVLLTTDRKFMNNANRIPANVRVMNPTAWLMEVIS